MSGNNGTGSSLSKNLKDNIALLKNTFNNSCDIVIREFAFGQKTQVHAALIFVDGLVEKIAINQSIIKPLMYDSRLFFSGETYKTDIDSIKSSLLSMGEVEKVFLLDKVVTYCLMGDTILLVDGYAEALVINAKGWENRGVEEPQTENVVRGPREGFTETLRMNTSLLRRKIRNPDLVFETMEIGIRTRTSVSIVYLKGIINPKLVDEVKRRLGDIKTDAILESGYIEQFIEDAPYSIFPTVGNSEKPDVVASKILDGRVAILVDGTPFVLTVPMLFVESFKSSEDYYSRYLFASIIRGLRFLSYLLTVLAPAIYLVLLTYHQEMIPTPLLFTLASSEEGLPFPTFLEMAGMLVVFEILREAGVRMPQPVGQAITIVGALVIGQAAVAAGIVSDFTVIVIALTAVSSFVVVPQTDSAIILRYILFILGGLMGGFGIIIGLIGVMIHLASLRSFGTPYLSPLAPLVASELKDVFVKGAFVGYEYKAE